MFTSTNLLVPALIFAAVGFLAGVLIMTLVGDQRRRREEAEKHSPVMDDLIVPEMPVLPETRFESIANLYRESRSGKLVTDVKGKVYLNRGSIPEDQLRNLQDAARNWQTWLGVPVVEPPPSAAPVEPVVEPPLAATAPPFEAAAETPVRDETPEVPEIEAESLLAEAEMPAAEEPAASEAPSEEPAPAAVAPTPAPGLPPIPVIPVVRPAPIEKPRSKTMVGQIDDVLQEMLPETVYATHNIHLGEEYTNGVVVWVGANKYIGIEAVPDPEIKALIQSAVRKWEASEGKV